MTPSEYRKKLARETNKALLKSILKGMEIKAGDPEKVLKYAVAGSKAGSTLDKVKSPYNRENEDEGR